MKSLIITVLFILAIGLCFAMNFISTPSYKIIACLFAALLAVAAITIAVNDNQAGHGKRTLHRH